MESKESSFKCDCCGLEVRESLGEWLGDMYGSPFYCQFCYEQYLRDQQDEDDPWLEQAAEHEHCALEGIYCPPPPGYPYGPYD